MNRTAKKIAPARATRIVAASLDDKDQRRLERYLERMAAQGVRMRPGQAVGALMRRGLDAVEQEARS